MKKLLSIISFLFISNSINAQMTLKERTYLTDYLTETRQNLLSEVSHLTIEQWFFKPSENVWSIAQICDHIVNAEISLAARSRQLLLAPEQIDKKIDFNERVEAVLDLISERNRDKIKIPVAPGTEPKKNSEIEWKSPDDYSKHFSLLRGKSINYVKTTDDNLMHHFMPPIEQLGEMNSYLWLVFMAAHSARHTAQIKEVKNHPNFPK